MIKNPKSKGQRYQEKAVAKCARSFKERLRQSIDSLLPSCKDFDEFLARMSAEGYEVRRRGKSLEFRAPEQEKQKKWSADKNRKAGEGKSLSAFRFFCVFRSQAVVL